MSRSQATAIGPATVANVAVGFDLLGFAIEGFADEVTVKKGKNLGVVISKIEGSIEGRDEIPRDAAGNTATAGLLRLCKDLQLTFGFSVEIHKKIPLSSGLGGSAASAVAAVVAANALLDRPLSQEQLLDYALDGESQASGSRHADNVAPCLYGGLIFCRSLNPIEMISIPVPKDIFCVVVHPNQRLNTKEARAVLKKEISLKDHISQSSNLAGFLSACYTNDKSLLARSLQDLIIEPQRAPLIRGFSEVKAAALAKGAMGCSISGAGPSVFAWCEGRDKAKTVEGAMSEAFTKAGAGPVRSCVSPISSQGARVIL